MTWLVGFAVIVGVAATIITILMLNEKVYVKFWKMVFPGEPEAVYIGTMTIAFVVGLIISCYWLFFKVVPAIGQAILGAQ